MIRLPTAYSRLTARRRYGLSVLLDLARVPLAGDDLPAARLEIVDRPREAPFVARRDRVEVPEGVLDWVTDLAGLAAEQRSSRSDQHGRVPADANPLARNGDEEDPLVSRVALDLRSACRSAQAHTPCLVLDPWPGGATWAAAITHDVDLVDSWLPLVLLRVVELVRNGHAGLAGQALRRAAEALTRDPLYANVNWILGAEADREIPSTWFFLAGQPTLRSRLAKDVTYDIASRASLRTLEAVLAGQHEVGLHGSFSSAEDASQQSSQKRVLDRHVPGPVRGVRQHFLRFRPGVTQRWMCDAGFEYDASAGFADRAGFRTGVADCVPAWDASREREIPLEMIPLAWMDRTSSKYSGVEDPLGWLEPALRTSDVARSVEGLWVGLWHPYLASATGYPGAEPAFVTLLNRLQQNRPWFARLADITEWRRWRRSILVRGIRADGTPDLVAPTAQWTSIGTSGLGGAGGPLAVTVC